MVVYNIVKLRQILKQIYKINIFTEPFPEGGYRLSLVLRWLGKLFHLNLFITDKSVLSCDFVVKEQNARGREQNAGGRRIYERSKQPTTKNMMRKMQGS